MIRNYYVGAVLQAAVESFEASRKPKYFKASRKPRVFD